MGIFERAHDELWFAMQPEHPIWDKKCTFLQFDFAAMTENERASDLVSFPSDWLWRVSAQKGPDIKRLGDFSRPEADSEWRILSQFWEDKRVLVAGMRVHFCAHFVSFVAQNVARVGFRDKDLGVVFAAKSEVCYGHSGAAFDAIFWLSLRCETPHAAVARIGDPELAGLVHREAIRAGCAARQLQEHADFGQAAIRYQVQAPDAVAACDGDIKDVFVLAEHKTVGALTGLDQRVEFAGFKIVTIGATVGHMYAALALVGKIMRAFAVKNTVVAAAEMLGVAMGHNRCDVTVSANLKIHARCGFWGWWQRLPPQALLVVNLARSPLRCKTR